MEEMERICCGQRTSELGVQLASARQPDELAERAEPRLAAATDGGGVGTAATHTLNLRPQADEADTPFVRFALVLMVPLLLFSAWQFARREQNENRLALVAGEVALRDVDVSCPGFWTRLVEITPNAGWVDFDDHGRPSDETSLSAATCSSLERVWRGKQGSFRCLAEGGCDAETFAAVSGIVTLAHESWHLRGIVNEAQTQCYAVQTTEAVARSLGVAPRDASVIARRVALDDFRSPAGEYHSAHCRPGGAYDLLPDTAAWPSG
jgi:hypothetical protein